MKLLVIGCGGVATVAIHKCCENPVFTEICIASRTVSKCDALVAKLKDKTSAKLSTATVDADSVDSLFVVRKPTGSGRMRTLAKSRKPVTIDETACVTFTVDTTTRGAILLFK